MADQPIAHTADGRPLFDNTPTVVCVIVENTEDKILAVRRANEPGKGKLGLPGGYHMRGETWQEAGKREVAEETCVTLHGQIWMISMETDEYGNNLVIAGHDALVTQKGQPVDGEAAEVVWLGSNDINSDDWAFPRHVKAVFRYFVLHAKGARSRTAML